MDIFDLTGKVAVVTGASSGLGVQFAKALARQGADLAIVARRLEKLNDVSEEIKKMGRKCLAFKCDVTNEQEVNDTVASIIEKMGRIDILVNNAGVAEVVPAENHTTEQWNRVLNTNLTGVFMFAREAGKNMIENKYGRVINITSMFGHIANTATQNSSYHASKGAVINLTRALAAEWAKHGITVNAIGPGFFESEMTGDILSNQEFNNFVSFRCPMGRVGNMGELDSALIFLAANSSSYVTGQTVFVDGGWTAV